MDIIYFLLIFLLIANLIKEYYFSYLREKGKNLATKKDIGDITKIVEGIKDDFIKENAQFKAKLDILVQGEQEFIKISNNFIIDFWISCDTLIFKNCHPNFANYNVSNGIEIINNDIQDIQNNYTLMHINYSKFKLFVDDIELLKITDNLIKLILELKSLTIFCLGNLKINYASNVNYSAKEVANKNHERIKKYHEENLEIIQKINETSSILRPILKEWIKNSYK